MVKLINAIEERTPLLLTFHKFQSHHSLRHFAETTSARWISFLARAHPLFDQGRDALRNRALPFGEEFFAQIGFRETEAITERDRIAHLFYSHSRPQIIRGEIFTGVFGEVDHPASR